MARSLSVNTAECYNQLFCCREGENVKLADKDPVIRCRCRPTVIFSSMPSAVHYEKLRPRNIYADEHINNKINTAYSDMRSRTSHVRDS